MASMALFIFQVCCFRTMNNADRVARIVCIPPRTQHRVKGQTLSLPQRRNASLASGNGVVQVIVVERRARAIIPPSA